MENIFLIDNHTHGAFGINFNYANYDEIKFVLKELFKRNIRGLCPTLVGESDERLKEQFEIFQKIRREQLKDPKDESLVLGLHLEGTFLSPKKAGIQDFSTFKKPDVENFKALCGGFEDIIKIITIAPEEDEGLIDYLKSNNIKVQAGHSLSWSAKNCKAITHLFNAMPQIHHRNPTLTLEALVEDDIYCEIIADLVHFSKQALKLILKTKPKNRIMLISDSLPCANFKGDIIFCNKKINSQGKDKNGTLAGSNKTLDIICKNLLEQKILAKEDIIQMGFKNQAEYLNLDNREINILNR